jgi:hypothetical protein
MATDNEHKTIHRRMAKLLGRSISGAAWTLACEESYVAEALDPAYGASREDGLVAFLKALLRVEDAGLRSRARSRQSASGRVLRGTESSARVEAVSRLAADLAAGDEEILRFRQRVLGRDTPMSADEAEAYLDLPGARQPRRTSPSASGPTVLKYQNRHVSHDLHVWPGSPLDELRKLAESLAKSYPWEPAQAAAFVLEGLVPLATPFMLRLPQAWHDGRPRRAKLIMEVDLWMPAAAVLRAYRDLQRQVLPGHNRPVSRRSIDLVNFVIQHRPATWPKLLERWNNEHPSATYADYRRFRYAFERARQSLLFPRYRPYMGSDDEV